MVKLLCSSGLTPAVAVSSGDTITVEMITHHAGDDYDKMIRGDPGMEDIYHWGPEVQMLFLSQMIARYQPCMADSTHHAESEHMEADQDQIMIAQPTLLIR